jgi:hypothetical protein
VDESFHDLQRMDVSQRELRLDAVVAEPFELVDVQRWRRIGHHASEGDDVRPARGGCPSAWSSTSAVPRSSSWCLAVTARRCGQATTDGRR